VIFDELEEVIRKLSKCKAPGSDGIPNEVWKSLIIKQNLLDSRNSWNNNSIPLDWLEVRIAPIFKKGARKARKIYTNITFENRNEIIYPYTK
jgi:hypothetical protein